MRETELSSIEEILHKQRTFFNQGNSKDISFRINALQQLKTSILKHETQITEALWKDLRKSREEVYFTEIGIVLQEINYHLKNLKKWAKPQKTKTPLILFPSKSFVLHEPLGVSLIISPWNYPFQMVINPLIGAISSGCTAIIKPSHVTKNTANLLAQMLQEIFDEAYVAIVQGGRITSELLLQQSFDMIFFTGSSKVGKAVMQAASKNLTPVILELGGKSPCIVDEDANLTLAARKIIWGKTINAGQTCIAPDYLFVHSNIKDAFIAQLKIALHSIFGTDIKQSKYYSRIVHQEAFDRLISLINEGNVLIGGEADASELFISPTVVDQVSLDSKLMQDEIFGPVLPVFTFEKIEEVISMIKNKEKPLAMYYFGEKAETYKLFQKISSGGACINDTLIHIGNHHLPFGGTGNSGMGKYHGKDSFLAFSNRKSVVTSPTWIDFPFRYAPYKYFKWIKKIFG